MARRSAVGGQAALLVTCVGLFMTQLDLTAVNVASGAIQSSLPAKTGAVTWVIDAYLVSFAALLLGLGDLADLVGRRRTFRVGMAVFVVASAACGAAPDATALIAARTVQGAAGAAVLVCSLAILVQGYPDSEHRRVIGMWSGVAGTALVIGPLFGGAMVDVVSWRAVFWINVPVGATGWWASGRALEESYGAERRGFDWRGQLLAVVALAGVAWGLEQGASSDWSSASAWLALAAGATAVAGLVVVERHVADPLLPLGLFRSRSFVAANTGALLVNYSTLGLLFVLSLYFERAQGSSAVLTGCRIVPLFAAYVGVSLRAGRVSDRFGTRLPALVGSVVSGAAILALSQLTAATFANVALLILAGAGVGLAMPALVASSVAAIPSGRQGLASGVNNTARQVGGTVGIALLGGIIATTTPFTHAASIALVVDGAGFVLSGLVALALSPDTAAETT